MAIFLKSRTKCMTIGLKLDRQIEHAKQSRVSIQIYHEKLLPFHPNVRYLGAITGATPVPLSPRIWALGEMTTKASVRALQDMAWWCPLYVLEASRLQRSRGRFSKKSYSLNVRHKRGRRRVRKKGSNVVAWRFRWRLRSRSPKPIRSGKRPNFLETK